MRLSRRCRDLGLRRGGRQPVGDRGSSQDARSKNRQRTSESVSGAEAAGDDKIVQCSNPGSSSRGVCRSGFLIERDFEVSESCQDSSHQARCESQLFSMRQPVADFPPRKTLNKSRRASVLPRI